MTPERRRLLRGLALMVVITLAAAAAIYGVAFHVAGDAWRKQALAVGAVLLVFFWAGFLSPFVRRRRPQGRGTTMGG